LSQDFFSVSQGPGVGTKTMAQWKYSLEEISADDHTKESLEGRLNEYGKDGWEVVTVWPPSLAENTERRLRVLLKRQVSLEEPTK
jgi:hypothetical protein